MVDRPFQHNKFDAAFLRSEIQKEKTITLDFGYLSEKLELWWKQNSKKIGVFSKNEMTSFLLNNIDQKDLVYFDSLGNSQKGIVAVCIKNIFSVDDKVLSFLVHESMSDLFGLVDIKYEYEAHKFLYLKPGGENFSEWGNGFGDISPHSDDLYESLETDYLSLTVCRDQTKTPTEYFFSKNILASLSDEDLNDLRDIEAYFISGKNVGLSKKKKRKVIEFSEKRGFEFSFDFRIDQEVGERMIPTCTKGRIILDKIRSNIKNCKKDLSIPETGTYLIICNRKILHSRSLLKITDKQISENTRNIDLAKTPRLLYRSKGQKRHNYLEELAQ